MQYLPRNEFIKCRLGCQTWKQDLDTVYQNHTAHSSLHGIRFPINRKAGNRAKSIRYNTDKSYGTYLYDAGVDTTTPYYGQRTVATFLANMERHPCNPFPGRSIAINLKPAFRDCSANLKRLLDKFGPEIWHAKILLKSLLGGTGPLRSCLLRLPNIKRLEIQIDNPTHIKNANQNLKSYFEKNPLPMETIVTDQTNVSLPRILVDEILKSCCNPETIKHVYLLNPDSVRKQCDTNFHKAESLNFPKLEVLYASIYCQELEKFGAALSIPKLRKLHLDIENETGFLYKPGFERFWKSLQVFKDSVVEMNLKFSDIYFKHPSVSFRMSFPKLEKLELEGYNWPLDALLQLNSLKYLGLIRCRFKKYDDGVVEIHGLEKLMLKSNIWSLMPQLDRLRIRKEAFDQVYYRFQLNQCKSSETSKDRMK